MLKTGLHFQSFFDHTVGILHWYWNSKFWRICEKCLTVWGSSLSISSRNLIFFLVQSLACGGQLDSFPGIITTPRYPLPYPNNRECSWKILAPPGMYIHVEFQGVYSLDYLCSYMECECKDILDIKDGGKQLPHVPFHGWVCTVNKESCELIRIHKTSWKLRRSSAHSSTSFPGSYLLWRKDPGRSWSRDLL